MNSQINSVSYPAIKGPTLEGVLMKRALKVPSLKIKMPKLHGVGKLPHTTRQVANQWKP